MRIVWILDVKKVPYDLSIPFAKVGAPQADNDNSNTPENFYENVFFFKRFDWNILFS